MTINNARLYNAALSGIAGGAIAASYPNDTHSSDYASYEAACQLAAAAVDAAIATQAGGVNDYQAGLLESLCYAVFQGRQVLPTALTSAGFTATGVNIAAIYGELQAGGAPSGQGAKIESITVGAITHPGSLVVALTDAFFIGANTISTQFNGAPSTPNLGIAGAWVTNTATGAIAVEFIALNSDYAGHAESVRVAVSS